MSLKKCKYLNQTLTLYWRLNCIFPSVYYLEEFTESNKPSVLHSLVNTSTLFTILKDLKRALPLKHGNNKSRNVIISQTKTVIIM